MVAQCRENETPEIFWIETLEMVERRSEGETPARVQIQDFIECRTRPQIASTTLASQTQAGAQILILLLDQHIPLPGRHIPLLDRHIPTPTNMNAIVYLLEGIWMSREVYLQMTRI